MRPFEKITSAELDAFPFEEVSNYAHTMLVDWRAGEDEIAEDFFRATGLPDSVSLEWDEKDKLMKFRYLAESIDIRRGDGVSSQHSMVMALQLAFGGSHSIRYVNIGDAASTALFVVEDLNTWNALETGNPFVRLFFTPVELLSDTFESDVAVLLAEGKKYAAGA